jgi:hypothetical protein
MRAETEEPADDEQFRNKCAGKHLSIPDGLPSAAAQPKIVPFVLFIQ